jgi:hypothetical protein
MSKEITQSDRLNRAYELRSLINNGIKKQVQGIMGMVEIGIGLMEMLNDKFYKELGYDDFESCVVEEWEMNRANAYRYIDIAKKLPTDFVSRVGLLDKPLSFRRLAQISVSFGPDPDKLIGLSAEDIEKLRDMSDDDFQNELTKLNGYDRSKHGGRGPNDAQRPEVSRDRYRDQHRKINILEEKLKAINAEKQELLTAITAKENELQDLHRVLASDDKTRELSLQISAITKRLGELESEKVRTEAEKVNADHATQLIAELRMNVLLYLKKFREQIYITDIEVAAWFDMTFDDLLGDIERNRNFIAAEFLDRIDKPYPEGASSALAVLTKQDSTIRKNIEKALADMGYRDIIDKDTK